jgi:hypothetical protein
MRRQATQSHRTKLDERIRLQAAIGASFSNRRVMWNVVDDAVYALDNGMWAV